MTRGVGWRYANVHAPHAVFVRSEHSLRSHPPCPPSQAKGGSSGITPTPRPVRYEQETVHGERSDAIQHLVFPSIPGLPRRFAPLHEPSQVGPLTPQIRARQAPLRSAKGGWGDASAASHRTACVDDQTEPTCSPPNVDRHTPAALSMNLPRFMVRVQLQPHRNRPLAMTTYSDVPLMAERVGFEPTEGLTLRRFSRPVH